MKRLRDAIAIAVGFCVVFVVCVLMWLLSNEEFDDYWKG